MSSLVLDTVQILPDYPVPDVEATATSTPPCSGERTEKFFIQKSSSLKIQLAHCVTDISLSPPALERSESFIVEPLSYKIEVHCPRIRVQRASTDEEFCQDSDGPVPDPSSITVTPIQQGFCLVGNDSNAGEDFEDSDISLGSIPSLDPPSSQELTSSQWFDDFCPPTTSQFAQILSNERPSSVPLSGSDRNVTTPTGDRATLEHVINKPADEAAMSKPSLLGVTDSRDSWPEFCLKPRSREGRPYSACYVKVSDSAFPKWWYVVLNFLLVALSSPNRLDCLS